VERLTARRLGLVVVLCLSVGPIRAQANTRSQQLYAKALLPFHAQRWQEAYVLLDQASKADPSDALAIYYHGLAAARLGFAKEAIADVERALALRSDLPGGALNLGILYFETGQFDSAEDWLQQAYRLPHDRFAAALYLGLSHYRRGDDAGARTYLADAAKDPALRPAARYYDALALLHQGRSAEARGVLAEVQTQSPDTEVGQIAQAYLSKGAGEQKVAAAPEAEKPWSVHGDVGFQYDTNVVLAPDSGAVKQSRSIGSQSDGRTALAVGGSYRLFDTAQARGVLSYDFYQSLNFDRSDFDLQGHRVRLDLASQPRRLGASRTGLQFGVSGLYDFYLLDFAGYYQEGSGTPWVTLFTGNAAATQLYYRFRSRDFLDNPFDPLRDAFNNAVGVREHLLLGAADRVLSFGYQWEDNDPLSKDGTDFAFYAHQFDADLRFPVLDWANGIAGYALRLEEYKHVNSRTDYTLHRHDYENQLVLRLERPLIPHLIASLEYLGVLNGSNLSEFEYNRHIVSAGVRLVF